MVGDNPLSLKFPPIKLYSLKKGKPISDCVVLSHLGLSLEFRFCKGVRKSEIESPNDQGSRVWILTPMVTSCCNAFFSAPASSLSLELSSEICMKYFRPSHLPVGWKVGLSYSPTSRLLDVYGKWGISQPPTYWLKIDNGNLVQLLRLFGVSWVFFSSDITTMMWTWNFCSLRWMG